MRANVARGDHALRGDAADLAAELTRHVDGDVRFDAGTRALYATDASNYRQVPIGVVLPRDTDDVEAAVEICRRFDAPVLPRGAGTSLAGQCCNVAVILDLARHVNGIGEVIPDARTVRVEPGAILDRVQQKAAGHGLMFGPDPSTHAWCTVGGMIGNNACGVHSLVSGTTADNVESLDVLTWSGTRLVVGALAEKTWAERAGRDDAEGRVLAALRALRDAHADDIRRGFPVLPRRVSGYNLDRLLPERGGQVARALVGTEGTCALVLGAELRLIPRPAARVLLVLGYASLEAAADIVPALLEHRPFGLEGFDDHLLAGLARHGRRHPGQDLLPDGRAWLLVELDGADVAAAVARARALQESPPGRAAVDGCLLEDPAAQRTVWTVREAGVGATARVPGLGDCWPGWEDAAVPPDRLGDYVRGFRELLGRHGLDASLYGHFGDGCVHARVNFSLDRGEGVRTFRAFVEEAADLVVAHGGSLSGEHGDGQARGELLARMYGDELVEAFRRFKSIWDPAGRMNPGKVVDPAPLDANLREQVRLREIRPDETFRYAADDGQFGRAVSRCVGMGTCLRDDTGTMCPSYRATRDERHSTRGRARLLFEMLAGEEITGGWNDAAVKEALDLCLACKACKSECPAGVDMATYKAEFLSRHHAKNGRPPTAWFFGLIAWWLRAGSLAPRLVNGLMGHYAVTSVVKRLGGIAPGRTLPLLAGQTFRSWFRRAGRLGPAGSGAGRRAAVVTGAGAPQRVLLWPDTFTNHYSPQIGQAAVAVLQAVGCHVVLPRRIACCGRPLYDQGMVPMAKRWLAGILDLLADEIRQETPVVVLEPSCLSVFQDELLQLLPDDPRAARLAGLSCSLDQFLARHAPGASLGTLSQPVVVQGHCHRQALAGMDVQIETLRRCAADVTTLEHGCCGMAGAFGFSREHVGVALAIGESGVLPAVRRAEPEALIVADGFSCREQIRQGTGRPALHVAEVLRTALDGSGGPFV